MKITDYKITIIGDSIPKGLELDQNLKVKKLNITAVSELEKKYGITICNNSIFGQTIKRVFKKMIIEDYLSSINKDDHNLLVISLGGNDADYNWVDVGINPNQSHSSKTSFHEFKNYLESITTMLKEKGVEVVFLTLFPMNSEYYFKNVIKKITNGDNVLKFLNYDITNLNRHQELFNNAILINAIKHNCKIIDIRSFFLNEVNYLDYCANDGIHPNEEGQKYIARIISKYIVI